MNKKNPRDIPMQLEPYPTYFYFAEKTKIADYEVQQLVDQVLNDVNKMARENYTKLYALEFSLVQIPDYDNYFVKVRTNTNKLLHLHIDMGPLSAPHHIIPKLYGVKKNRLDSELIERF